MKSQSLFHCRFLSPTLQRKTHCKLFLYPSRFLIQVLAVQSYPFFHTDAMCYVQFYIFFLYFVHFLSVSATVSVFLYVCLTTHTHTHTHTHTRIHTHTHTHTRARAGARTGVRGEVERSSSTSLLLVVISSLSWVLSRLKKNHIM